MAFSNGSLASQIKNNKTIGVDKLEHILQSNPDLSAEWLLTGKGDMIQAVGVADRKNYLTEKNTVFLNERVKITDAIVQSIVAKTYPNTDLIGGAKRLQEMVTGFDKRIIRELPKTHKELFDLLELIHNIDALQLLIAEVFSAYITNKPNPGDIYQYLDIEQKTEFIPDKLDYKKYREDVILWLESVNDYKEAIRLYYDQGELLLKALKPIDKEKIID
jgi:hypothetical protein